MAIMKSIRQYGSAPTAPVMDTQLSPGLGTPAPTPAPAAPFNPAAPLIGGANPQTPFNYNGPLLQPGAPAAPTPAPTARRRPLMDKLRMMDTPPSNFWLASMWRAARNGGQ